MNNPISSVHCIVCLPPSLVSLHHHKFDPLDGWGIENDLFNHSSVLKLLEMAAYIAHHLLNNDITTWRMNPQRKISNIKGINHAPEIATHTKEKEKGKLNGSISP